MTDQDIVTRLRGHIAITLHLNYPKDGYPESVYVHGPSPICQEAADEIERLEAALVAVTQERDEARREVCRLDAELPEERLVSYCAARLPKDVAAKRGWDCFDRSKYAKRRKPIAK